MMTDHRLAFCRMPGDNQGVPHRIQIDALYGGLPRGWASSFRKDAVPEMTAEVAEVSVDDQNACA